MPFAMNLSRADAMSMKNVPANTVIVSITDPDRQLAALPGGFAGIIRLQFLDISDVIVPVTDDSAVLRFTSSPLLPPSIPTDAIVFTDEMAIQLAEFLKKHLGQNVIAHCEAGISRSGAVVETMIEVYGYEDWGGPRHPNQRVKRLLKKALGVEPPLFKQ